MYAYTYVFTCIHTCDQLGMDNPKYIMWHVSASWYHVSKFRPNVMGAETISVRHHQRFTVIDCMVMWCFRRLLRLQPEISVILIQVDGTDYE